jgi:hypothetical protein
MALHSHRDGLFNPSPGFCVWNFCNRLSNVVMQTGMVSSILVYAKC